MAVYASALLALAGWMVQTWNTARVGRKQHSMNVLIQTRFSEVHRKHLEIVSDGLAGAVEFSAEKVMNDANLRRSLAYLLNYFEFIAVALNQGDLDETIIREAIRGQLTDAVAKSRSYISFVRGEDPAGNPKPEKALVYCRLLPLASRWEKFGAKKVAKLLKNKRA